MIRTFEKFAHFQEKILGVDLDGVLNDYVYGFNTIYHKYFPDKRVIPPDEINDWYWYKKLDYNGQNPYHWVDAHRQEMWKVSIPYPGAVEKMKQIYEYTQNNGIMLRIVTCQPGPGSSEEALNWLRRNGIKYDDISFVPRSLDKWDQSDVQIDDAPHVISTKPDDKVSIKVEQLWNENVRGDFNIYDITFLTPKIIEKAFKKFNVLNENKLDPYNEEIWDLNISDIKIGDIIHGALGVFEVVNIKGNNITLKCIDDMMNINLPEVDFSFDEIKEYIEKGTCRLEKKR